MKYHYTKSEFAAKMIASKYLYASDPRSFNDPSEFKIRVDSNSFSSETIKRIESEYGETVPNINMAEDSMLENAAKRFSVVCFSATRKSILMWSHYADKHKGVVLGSDETKCEVLKQNLHKVNYEMEPPVYRHPKDDSEESEKEYFNHLQSARTGTTKKNFGFYLQTNF